jgi:hypothetical protein
MLETDLCVSEMSFESLKRADGQTSSRHFDTLIVDHACTKHVIS